MGKKRHRPVPEVLRRVFHDRARALGDLILSLSSKECTKEGECLCRGRGCVTCGGASFLLRQEDGPDYRQLLERCFCVVSLAAPTLTDLCYRGEWTQLQIVRHMEKSLMGRLPSCDNVKPKGYGEQSRANISERFLCDPPWDILLTRIGESAMMFLLKYSSIFIPLPTNNHHQVTGLPLNKVLQTPDLLHNPKIPVSLSKDWLLERQPADNGVLKSATIEVCSIGSRKRKRLYSWQRHRRCKRKNDLTDRSESCRSFMNDKERRDNVFQGESEVECESTERMMEMNCSSIIPKYGGTNQNSTYLAKPNPLIEKAMHGAFEQESNVKHLDATLVLPCLNCLMLRSAPKISEAAEIRKKHMFYNSDPSYSVFTGNHILNRLKPNNSCADALLRHIFNLSGEGLEAYLTMVSCVKKHCLPTSGCLHHSLLRLCKTLIRNSRKCHYMELLRKHCPVLSYWGISHRTGMIFEAPCPVLSCREKNVDHKKKVHSWSSRENSYCEQKEVVSFIWAATRSIVPVDLLGDYSNWRALRGNISKFVRLHRFEMFSINQCINRLQTSKFPFLSNIPPCNCQKSNEDWTAMKQKFLHLWIYWFFSHMVVPLLRANFYVTETEFGKHETLYYPKPIWNDMLAKTLNSLKKLKYQPIDLTYFMKVTNSRAFGFSRVRFLPKEKGMRLLANLRAPSKAWLPLNERKLVHFRSVNSALHEVHSVLKRIKIDNPQMLGASVFDYNDVYQLLRGFLLKFKNGSMATLKVFIVVADVSKAFDSIDQDKLLDVMKAVIMKDEYFLRKYAQISCTKKTMSTRYGYVCLENDMASALASIRSSSSHSIIVDQGIFKRITRAEIHNLLCEHVKNNILQLGKEFCIQKSGVSQGSLLSSLLCSFYLGHVERKIIFPFLQRIPNSADVREDPSSLHPHYTLLRLVDDFLFISTSKEQATSFFNRIRRGFREYNCYMNREKFGVNFELSGQRNLKANRKYVGADGIPFLPWSGVLINCLTLEIQADYTRYLGIHLRSTITLHGQSDVEDHLREKLCNYMRPKCHPLFYDSNINSPAIVLLNLYQAFLISAMKFHCCFSALPGCSLTPSRCLHIITESCSYMHRLIKKRMYGVGRRKMEPEPVLRLKKAETVWLGLSAYIRVLRKKQTRHKELLSLLHSALLHRGPLLCNPSHLSYAVDDSHSSVFWQIKF